MQDFAILVVEDDPDYLQLTLRALRECGNPARIGSAPDGEAALDYLFGRAAHDGRDALKQPRLVILDMQLGDLHGLDVLKAIRADARTRSVPVIILTGSTDRAALDNCYTSGANSVIGKSGDFEELRRKMRTVYDFWITVNEGNRHSRV